jgi:hypothetical protein
MHVEKRKKRPALSPFPTFFLPEAAHPCAVPFSPPTAGPASPNRRRATLFARRRHSPVRPANRHAPLLLRPLARPSAPPAAGAPRRALPEQDASAATSCALCWNSSRPPPRPSLCFASGQCRTTSAGRSPARHPPVGQRSASRPMPTHVAGVDLKACMHARTRTSACMRWLGSDPPARPRPIVRGSRLRGASACVGDPATHSTCDGTRAARRIFVR